MSLTGLPALQNTSNSIAFRLYGYGFPGYADKGLGLVPGDNPDLAVAGSVYYPVATPTFNPPGGSYSGINYVTISSGTAGASISYTTDGSPPTPGHGTVYTGPVALSTNTILQAVAYQTNFVNSAVASASYFINLQSPVVIRRQSAGANLQLNWTGGGQLQQATNLAGPWLTNAAAASPWTVSPINDSMFYRIGP